MVSTKKIAAMLGVGAVMAAGIVAVGATPANADSLRIGDWNGHVGVSLNLGTPAYCAPAPVYYAPAPVYVEPAPVYYVPGPVWYGHGDRGRFSNFRGRDRR